MPCFELFERQSRDYREEVLPPEVTARISIEAGTTFGWDRYVGPFGRAIGIDRFGASAPADDLFEKFGITASRVAAVAQGLLSIDQHA
jgi:transketolase